MLKTSFFLTAVVLSVAPAWAINKCKAPDGKVVFQDAPCAGQGEKIDVRPASGNAPAALAQPTSAQPARPTPAKEGAFGESWQRRTYLENRGVADARGALQAHKMQCDARQRELSAQKGQATNNLAGATWLQAIATEMQAAATLCDSKQRDLQAQLDGLEKELRELQAKQ